MAKKNVAIQFSDEDYDKIEKLAAMGLTLQQIASVWDRGRRTFELYSKDDDKLRDAIDAGRNKANMAVSKTAYSMAVSGKVPAMTMFWLKCRARWKETTHHEVSGKLTLENLIAGASGSDKDE